MEKADNFSVVFVTVPTKEEGESIARALVERDLAACVNIIPSVQSVYKWDGKLNIDDELLLVIKGSSSELETIEKKVLQLHSYDTPEVISFALDKGNKEYLDWMSNTQEK
ncbi:MAG: divalent-cation tolerance protein CutA [Nitrospinota bacterium]|nr:divalent-cation tolerance protein CutA [Nitrospinota bacterium]